MAARRRHDVVVVGAGIAGLSAAAELASECDVAVVEMEPAPAHHATGRSAALLIPTYGPPSIRRLTRAGRAWFETRGEGRADTALLTPRDVLYVSDEARLPALEELRESMGSAGGVLELLDAEEARSLCPALQPGWFAGAGVDRDAGDLDVAAIVAVFRRLLSERGGTLSLEHRGVGLERDGDGWRVETSAATLGCELVVDAAGAWADRVAALAGAKPVGFVPKRRTLAVSRPTGPDAVGEGFVANVPMTFYFGAEPGGVLFSPGDETPSEPCDARPEELDVALAIERINTATTLGLRSVSSSWAGLRTFSPDGSIVIGPDPAEPGFVWCAGQGGYGIHTAPAAARATAALALGRGLPSDLAEGGLTPEDLGVARLR